MIVKRMIGARNSDQLIANEDRARMEETLRRRFRRAQRVKVVASADGPIAEVTMPDDKGGYVTHVGRYDALGIG